MSYHTIRIHRSVPIDHTNLNIYLSDILSIYCHYFPDFSPRLMLTQSDGTGSLRVTVSGHWQSAPSAETGADHGSSVEDNVGKDELPLKMKLKYVEVLSESDKIRTKYLTSEQNVLMFVFTLFDIENNNFQKSSHIQESWMRMRQ